MKNRLILCAMFATTAVALFSGGPIRAAPLAQAACDQTYTVAAGDSLASIALVEKVAEVPR